MHRELDPAGALLIPLLAVLALGAAVPKDPPPLASKRPVTDRYFDIMDSENTIVDPATPRTLERPKGELAFEGVHFRYHDSPERFGDLLDGVDLVVRPGETLWSIASESYPGDPREGVWELERRNGLTGATIVPGQRLTLP